MIVKNHNCIVAHEKQSFNHKANTILVFAVKLVIFLKKEIFFAVSGGNGWMRPAGGNF